MPEIIRVTHRSEGQIVSVIDWKINDGEMEFFGSIGHIKPISRLIAGWSLEDAILNVEDAFAFSPDSVLFTPGPVIDGSWVDSLFKRTNGG